MCRSTAAASRGHNRSSMPYVSARPLEGRDTELLLERALRSVWNSNWTGTVKLRSGSRTGRTSNGAKTLCKFLALNSIKFLSSSRAASACCRCKSSVEKRGRDNDRPRESREFMLTIDMSEDDLAGEQSGCERAGEAMSKWRRMGDSEYRRAPAKRDVCVSMAACSLGVRPRSRGVVGRRSGVPQGVLRRDDAALALRDRARLAVLRGGARGTVN